MAFNVVVGKVRSEELGTSFMHCSEELEVTPPNISKELEVTHLI